MNKFVKLVATMVSFVGIAYAAPGAYVQVQGGIGGMDTPDDSNSTYAASVGETQGKVSLRDGLAYRLSAGYLFGQTNLNYGLELGYASYAKNTYKANTPATGTYLNETYRGYNVDLLAVAKYNAYPDATGFYVVGKAGVAYLSETETIKGLANFLGEDFTFKGSSTDKQFKPEVVVGAGYDFNRNVGLNVSYSHIFASNGSASDVASINTVMAGLTYSFS